MKVAKNNQVSESKPVSISAQKYSAASEHIQAAIAELGKIAKDDILAQESIANLGVVLLDLRK